MKVGLPTEAQRADRDPRIPLHVESKTGVYFTTVCEDCHRRMSTFDESFKDLMSLARTQIPLFRNVASEILICVPSNHIVLSVLNHTLTSRFEPARSVFEDTVRRIVHGDAKNAECDPHLYLWPYFGRPVVSIMHDFVLPFPGHNVIKAGSILKFEPLAFYLCEGPIPRLDGIRVLDAIRSPTRLVPIVISPGVDSTWPESAPFRLGGKRMAEHVVAVPDA